MEPPPSSFENMFLSGTTIRAEANEQPEIRTCHCLKQVKRKHRSAPHLNLLKIHLSKSGTCRVREFCIQRGSPWASSLAKSAGGESEYYEELLTFYRQNYRVMRLTVTSNLVHLHLQSGWFLFPITLLTLTSIFTLTSSCEYS